MGIYADHHLHVASTRLSLNSNFTVQIKRSGVFNITFNLPSDYEVEDVQAAHLSYWDVDNTPEGNKLTLFMNKKVLGQLPIQIRLVKIISSIPENLISN